MKEIRLGKSGKVALVDDEDYERAIQYSWCISADGYVCTLLRPRGGKQRRFQLHRLILNDPPGKEVDHKNQDRLDCRKGNLRVATHANNACNRPKQRNNTSGFKGVSVSNSIPKPWWAQIKLNGRKYYLGYFKTREEAARAYDQAAIRLHGEFACLNFPESACAAAREAMKGEE